MNKSKGNDVLLFRVIAGCMIAMPFMFVGETTDQTNNILYEYNPNRGKSSIVWMKISDPGDLLTKG